jgi:hypothetical protein
MKTFHPECRRVDVVDVSPSLYGKIFTHFIFPIGGCGRQQRQQRQREMARSWRKMGFINVDVNTCKMHDWLIPMLTSALDVDTSTCDMSTIKDARKRMVNPVIVPG